LPWESIVVAPVTEIEGVESSAVFDVKRLIKPTTAPRLA
jgi:hypothetical protein